MRLALDRLRAHIQRATGVCPVVRTDGEVEAAPGRENAIVLGSTETNTFTRELSRAAAFVPEPREQGYAAKTFQNPRDPGKLVLLIAGRQFQCWKAAIHSSALMISGM